MLILQCGSGCGNRDQNGFEDTEKGFICKKCGQPAFPMENNEPERMRPVPKLNLEIKFGTTVKTKFGFGTYLCNSYGSTNDVANHNHHLSRYYALINQPKSQHFNKVVDVVSVDAYTPKCWKCGKTLSSWENHTCLKCHYLVCDNCKSCSKEHVDCSELNKEYIDKRFYLSTNYDLYKGNSLGPFPISFGTTGISNIWPPFVFNPNFILSVETLLDNGIRFGLLQAPSTDHYVAWNIDPYWETFDLRNRDKTYDILRSKGIIKDYIAPF